VLPARRASRCHRARIRRAMKKGLADSHYSGKLKEFRDKIRSPPLQRTSEGRLASYRRRARREHHDKLKAPATPTVHQVHTRHVNRRLSQANETRSERHSGYHAPRDRYHKTKKDPLLTNRRKVGDGRRREASRGDGREPRKSHRHGRPRHSQLIQKRTSTCRPQAFQHRCSVLQASRRV